MRPKSWTDEELIQAVKESRFYVEVARKLGLKTSSNRTMDRIRYRCDELKLDRSHFAHGGGRKGFTKTNEMLFVDGIEYNATHRRRYLTIVEYKCHIEGCGISEWHGKKLVLQIDHIDGNRWNNQLSNLRLICANCHSQTSTWGWRKVKEY